MKAKRVYFPMTCSILTPGHIKCLKFLSENYRTVIIGLLTEKALKGYKNGVTAYKDREYILSNLGIKHVIIVPQDSLNPKDNLIKYKCTFMASGDGWEKSEKDAVTGIGIELIDIKLPGEKSKKYSSTKVYKNLKCATI